jgi:hypothetical protein
MCGECMENVWRMYGECMENVWRMYGSKFAVFTCCPLTLTAAWTPLFSAV